MKTIIIILTFLLGFYLLPIKNTSINTDFTEYEIEKDSVWINTSNGIVFGFMYKPVGLDTSKVPAVLCLQGGGDVGLNNYLYEARFFAKQGMMALICDKSGAGLSKTKKSWREQSFKDKTNEYSELFDWLSKQKNVDSNKVGVHGMSEGGRLAVNMAIEYPDKIAFVNSVSGPIESYKKNQLYAIKQLLLSRGVQPSTTEKVVNVWSAYFSEIAKGNILKETVNKVNEIRRQYPNVRYLPSNSTELPSRPLSKDINFTLENRMDNIKCPILFQYGELDILVNPKKSISLIPKNLKFEIINYAETDHSMNLKNGNVQPKFLDDKKKWLIEILK